MVRERLIALDLEARRLSYDFVGEAPFPVRQFLAVTQILPVTETGSSFVLWSCGFSADEEIKAKLGRAFTSLFSGFVRDLRAHLRPAQRDGSLT